MYTKERKASAIEFYQTHNVTIGEAAWRSNIHPSVLGRLLKEQAIKVRTREEIKAVKHAKTISGRWGE